MIEELKKVKTAGESSALSAVAATQSSAPKEPVAPAGPPPANARPSPAAKGKNIEQSGQSGKDDATETALAEVLSKSENQCPASLNSQPLAGQKDAAKSLSNLELAHEVMRLCIRKIVAEMAQQSGSTGEKEGRQDRRAYAIEHAKNTQISRVVLTMVVKDAYARLKAEAAGFMGGGHTQGDPVVFQHDPAAAEAKDLAGSVLKASFRKASIDVTK